MKKYRIVTAIAVAGLVALGLGASSASASSPLMVEIEGVCLDVDANGLPNPVPCPPDADNLDGDGMFNPFADMCWEQQAGGYKLPVPCPEDDSQDSEAPEWCLEEQVDGSYLIVPCPEDQLMIPMIPEIHFFPWLSDSDSEVGEESAEIEEESAEVEEAPTEENSEEAPIEDSGEAPIEDSEEAPAEEVSDDSQGTVESGRALSYEATDSGTELLMAATPGAADNQTDQSSNEFAAVSVGSERSIDNVETASVQPGAAAPDTPSEWGSLALIAGIALVLLGGGGLAAVGMAASRKRV
ncbi:MAG: hypothetical protein CL445_00020 [Acidimicrobiaceae bacterium]|nr:hypothetical protein [Acidimicrobiaceae bacterium]